MSVASDGLTLAVQQVHPEGGYFVETDRDALQVPNPFGPTDAADSLRNASTSIYYLLTPKTSFGAFHRNKGRTVHTLHRGRGRYVLVHADRAVDGKAPVESFIVGHNVLDGERLQWIVEGGKYKASFLLPDKGSDTSDGLLISEVRVILHLCVRVALGVSARLVSLLPHPSSPTRPSLTNSAIAQTVVPGFEFKDHDFLTASSFKELRVPDELSWLVRSG